MLRPFAVASFVFAMLFVAACGRQITPNPSISNLAGHIDLRFRVREPFAFTKYDYQIVIDTCGRGVPLPNPGTTSSLKNYTFSFNVGTSQYGVGILSPLLFQYTLTTGTNGFSPRSVPLDPSLYSFNANSNVSGTEFELVFDRELLADPLGPTAAPCAALNSQSSASMFREPSVAAGVSPFARATNFMAVAEAATTSPSPSTSATPAPATTAPSQESWTMNFIVLTPAGVPVDSLGQGGPSDNTYSGVIVPTNVATQQPVIKIPDISGAPTDGAAAIIGGEVDNYP